MKDVGLSRVDPKQPALTTFDAWYGRGDRLTCFREYGRFSRAALEASSTWITFFYKILPKTKPRRSISSGNLSHPRMV
ncbi:hypothetical protein ACC848_39805, partial [Rhizobium johnstonii]